MSDVLSKLEPRALWSYFAELSRIPRGSKNERAAADWVAEQGRKLGCEVVRDSVGNVLIRKKAFRGKEGRPGVVLQAHVDMVCEKNEGTVHDFEKDPIRPRLEGDHLYATGTTLGADNGVGVCAGLAVLASNDIPHGPLELLVTVDEESGLTGAKALPAGLLQGKYLMNLDAEEEGILTIGCAGGLDLVASRRLSLVAPSAGKRPYRLKVSGLKGGHSGMDIHQGRGNAIRLLAQVMNALMPRFGLELASFQGGNKRNAVPREASTIFFMEPSREVELREEVAHHAAHWQRALASFDPGVALSVEPSTASQAIASQDAAAFLGLLLVVPHGVEAMTPGLPGLVQTSTNLGTVEIRDGRAELITLTRSSIDASRNALGERIAAACHLAGYECQNDGSYPGWKPEPASAAVKLMSEVHQRVFGKKPEIMAVHAGLECGIIGEKYPGMEMIAFGPSMWDVHTPDEHVSVSSVANFWKLLVAALGSV